MTRLATRLARRPLLTRATGSAIAVAASLAATAAGGGWIDDLHAWELSDDIQAVRSTSDGGVTWRRILGGVGELEDLVLTGPGIGLVVAAESTASRRESYWTLDDGKHWFLTSFRAPDAFVGHGRFLFWSRGGQLLRVRSWPPRGDATVCRLPFEPQTSFRGSICFAPKQMLRSDVVADVRDGFVLRLGNVPGGVIALLGRGNANAPFLRTLVRRLGRNVVALLPVPDELQQAKNYLGLSGFTVDYPLISLIAFAPGSRNPLAYWYSQDGGVSWSLGR